MAGRGRTGIGGDRRHDAAVELGAQTVPASRAGIFVNLEPLVGALLGVVVLHDVLESTALVGGVLIIGGAAYFSVT